MTFVALTVFAQATVLSKYVPEFLSAPLFTRLRDALLFSSQRPPLMLTEQVDYIVSPSIVSPHLPPLPYTLPPFQPWHLIFWLNLSSIISFV